MKKISVQIFCLLAFIGHAVAQSYLPLQDNWQIPSDTSIKIIAGNYSFSDTPGDGVIQIIGKQNITIDGDSVTVDGTSFNGYMIYIENSNNITIKNFQSVKNYYYAVYAVNSQNITIDNCTFSMNKKDTVGWIVIFDGPSNALGGGVFMDGCSNSSLSSNTMQYQNDGIAVYNCDSITIQNNNLSWNTAYGIRMYRTDSCYIYNNNCSHADRVTDPSDCAAILLLESNENRVLNNDFTYSGDGIFLNQKNSVTPSNNYFAYNDCSYSPHNAIEAVFSEGNIFKHNKANNSNYGLWLGYSFNTVVDSNEIMNNSGIDPDGGGGIAIDRGYNNTITNNTIKHNSHGIKVWEKGSPIFPYTNTSQDYLIENNLFYGNKYAIYAENTERLLIKNDTFSYNSTDIQIFNSATSDTITNSVFDNTVVYYIENNSSDDIYAVNNTFPDDTALIACKIYDVNDTSTSGEVLWNPYNSGLTPVYEQIPPTDLMEKPSVWDAFYYLELTAPTTISWDSVEKKTGNHSLFIDTEGGWDVIFHYFPPDDKISSWDLSGVDTISFWMKCTITDPNNPWGVQETYIKLGNSCGGYYKYANDDYPNVLNASIGQWTQFFIPLTGNSTWAKDTVGNISLADINYVEINVDVWEYGYELWIDGFSFSPAPTVGIKNAEVQQPSLFHNFPDPVNRETTIRFLIPKTEMVSLKVIDSIGREVETLINEKKSAGVYEIVFDGSELPNGVYYYRLQTGNFADTKKFVLIK